MQTKVFKVRKGVTAAPEMTCRNSLGVLVLDLKMGSDNYFVRKDLRLWKNEEAARAAGKVVEGTMNVTGT